MNSSTELLFLQIVLAFNLALCKKNEGYKNDIISQFSRQKQICMDVCSPSYYSYEYPAQENYNYDPFENSGEYSSFEERSRKCSSENCYRKLMKKLKINPASLDNVSPRVFKYKKRSGRTYKNGRKWNFRCQNCQLICYPVLVQQYPIPIIPTKIPSFPITLSPTPIGTNNKPAHQTKPPKPTQTTESSNEENGTDSSLSFNPSTITLAPPEKRKINQIKHSLMTNL